MAESRRTPSAHLLIFPYPAQGHMLPLLDFAHLLSSRGFTITIVVTPANYPLLSPLLSKSPSIQTLVLPFPSSSLLPPGIENAKGLPVPQFAYLFHLLRALHDPLLAWIRCQTTPVSTIISDFFLGWTQPLAVELGIPRIVFSPSGILGSAVTHSLFRRMPKRPDLNDDDYPVDFPSIPNSPVYPWRQLSRLFRSYVEGDEVSESLKQNFLWNLESWGIVSNTFRALEGPYLERPIEDLGWKRVWAVGPLAPKGSAADRGGRNRMSEAEVTTWLDAFPEASVVYVSFGSQAALSPPLAATIAAALEKSGAPFVWAEAQGTAAIPEDLADRTVGRGLVIRGWAPQVAILHHPAVGSFLTHCGWNSVLEAVAAGVAMLTWPLTADQFVNARLVENEAPRGVRAWEGLSSVPDPDELARVVSESLGESGKELRERVKDLSRKSTDAVNQNGSSHADLEELVQELLKLL
ncbi:UDP-glycosyltransferase 89B2 [Typha latifolia]|uniref:UDP-glycosyltransferase 89B2 n=1 Tax=Typha latifolia TaxID=4733 RepID=UPI003C2B58DF